MTALERLATVARQLPGRRPRAVVLVYHRIGERALDPWRLTIDAEIFAGQMETLARDWSLRSHSTSWSRASAGGGCPNEAVAMRSTTATPTTSRSRRRSSSSTGSATLFVAADLVEAGGPPWWDELASLLLEPARLPPTLTLSICGGRWRVTPLAAGKRRSAANAPLPWEAEPGTRLRAFYEIWLALRALDAPTRESALDEIAEWSGAPRPTGRLPDVGAGPTVRRSRRLRARHTLTHPALAGCSPEDARAGVAGGAGYGLPLTGRRQWSSSPTPSARGPGTSPAWSPSSASAPPTRPTELRSRGARRRTAPTGADRGRPGDFAELLADLRGPLIQEFFDEEVQLNLPRRDAEYWGVKMTTAKLAALAFVGALALLASPATRLLRRPASGTRRRSSARTETTTWSVQRPGTSASPARGTIAFARAEATTWCAAVRARQALRRRRT